MKILFALHLYVKICINDKQGSINTGGLFVASTLILLQLKNHNGDVGAKRKGNPSCIYLVLIEYTLPMQRATFLNWLNDFALELCHMAIDSFFHNQLEGSVTLFFLSFSMFLFYCFVSRCIVLQGLHVRTGGNRIQANLA